MSKLFLVQTWSAKYGLLLRSVNGGKVRHPILAVELHADLPAQSGCAAVQASRFDTGDIWHHFKLRVQARPAVSAEEVPESISVRLDRELRGVLERTY